MNDRRAPRRSPSFAELLWLTRRAMLKGAVSANLASLFPGALAGVAGGRQELGFVELQHRLGPELEVAPGYTASVLLRWGDPLFADAPPWQAQSLDAAAQARQFGYNNDFVGYFPLPADGAGFDRGLLCVNHEYTHPDYMWADFRERRRSGRVTPAHVDVELAAHGMSVVEIRHANGGWQVRADSPRNRRITGTTPVGLAGPAAGHARLRTRDDPDGRIVSGCLNNCGGGRTPWGTVLSAEENFHLYFSGRARTAGQRRYKLGNPQYPWWAEVYARFDLNEEPDESNRFGWIVEVDPYEPDRPPVKRTALGRLAHEAATAVLDADGRLVVYSGDDAAFEYIYKFVSRRRVDPSRREANRDLLDDGDLYVARFAADGSLRWLPLIHGHGPLTAANGFADQGEVLIEARRAADLLGATPMDRPEYLQVHPWTGTVFVALTNNERRGGNRVDGPNPRARNRYGHLLALQPPGDDKGTRHHAADRFSWELALLAGDPGEAGAVTTYHPRTGAGGWFACPDNFSFDPQGRLWIATDRDQLQASTGCSDGLWACTVEGPEAFLTKCFLLGPAGAEICSPEFTADGRNLFVAVQHPGVVGGRGYRRPASRWPDFIADRPARPAVIVIRKDDGGVIGGG